MESVPTCLIESNYLVREGLKILFGETKFKIVEEIDNPVEKAENADLVILGLNENDNNLENLVNQVKNYYASSRIVVLSSGIQPDFIKFCFSHNIDGYLAKNMPPSSLLGSLNMIMEGEKMYPATALEFFMSNDKRNKTDGNSLSNREVEILKHVADGKTNKEIALHRNIAESTVKAHLKTILRKLSLSNRTQAARWAFNEGLAGTGHIESVHAVNENSP